MLKYYIGAFLKIIYFEG